MMLVALFSARFISAGSFWSTWMATRRGLPSAAKPGAVPRTSIIAATTAPNHDFIGFLPDEFLCDGASYRRAAPLSSAQCGRDRTTTQRV